MARYSNMASWSDDQLRRTLETHQHYKKRAQRDYDAAVARVAEIEKEISERFMEALAAQRAA